MDSDAAPKVKPFHSFRASLWVKRQVLLRGILHHGYQYTQAILPPAFLRGRELFTRVTVSRGKVNNQYF